MQDAAVADHDLDKAHNRQPVFRRLSFAVEFVENFALAGRNGAGSTVTMKILQRVRTVDGDEVALLGFHPVRAPGYRTVGSW